MAHVTKTLLRLGKEENKMFAIHLKCRHDVAREPIAAYQAGHPTICIDCTLTLFSVKVCNTD